MEKEQCGQTEQRQGTEPSKIWKEVRVAEPVVRRVVLCEVTQVGTGQSRRDLLGQQEVWFVFKP